MVKRERVYRLADVLNGLVEALKHSDEESEENARGALEAFLLSGQEVSDELSTQTTIRDAQAEGQDPMVQRSADDMQRADHPRGLQRVRRGPDGIRAGAIQPGGGTTGGHRRGSKRGR